MRRTRRWKFRDQQRPRGWLARRQGFVLITSYLVVAVLLILQSAYFSRVVEDHHATSRHMQTIAATHYADAGLDQAIASLRANPNYAGTAGVPVPVGAGDVGAYNITVSAYAGDATLRRVVAQGYSLNPTTNPAAIPRTVNAILKVTTGLSNWGVFGLSSVSGSGNAVMNAYDSAAGVYGGGNINTTAANIGTNGTTMGNVTLTGNVNLGGGDLYCGQGCTPNTTILTGANVVYDAKLALTQPQSFALVSAPPLPQGYVAAPVNMASNAITVLNASSPSVFMTSSGRRAVVISSLSVSGQAQYLVDATNGPIDIYVQGSVALSGNAVVGNQTIGGAATAVTLYQTLASSISVAGNAVVTAAVYAPSSAVAMSVNGTVYGTAIGNTVTLSGNATLHYDMALGNGSGGSGSAAHVTLVEWNF